MADGAEWSWPANKSAPAMASGIKADLFFIEGDRLIVTGPERVFLPTSDTRRHEPVFHIEIKRRDRGVIDQFAFGGEELRGPQSFGGGGRGGGERLIEI